MVLCIMEGCCGGVRDAFHERKANRSRFVR